MSRSLMPGCPEEEGSFGLDTSVKISCAMQTSTEADVSADRGRIGRRSPGCYPGKALWGCNRHMSLLTMQ